MCGKKKGVNNYKFQALDERSPDRNFLVKAKISFVVILQFESEANRHV